MNEHSSVHTPAPYLSKSPQILKDLPEFTGWLRALLSRNLIFPFPAQYCSYFLGLMRKKDELIYLTHIPLCLLDANTGSDAASMCWCLLGGRWEMYTCPVCHKKNDLAIPLLGIHTEETRIERDTCTPVFIAALFIIARTWKQPRCPSGWTNG